MKKPDAQEVHVWQSRLDGDCSEGNTLSHEEIQRADRFHFQEHRERFIHAHSMLRDVLAGYLDITPHELEFLSTSDGKPYLAGHALYFNLSHSADHAIIAVATAGEVGVDIEIPRAARNIIELAKRYYTAKEQAAIEAAEETSRESTFLRIWTAKEAILKAAGTGLRMATNSFDTSDVISDGSGKITIPVGSTNRPYHCQMLDAKPPAIASVATGFNPTTIQLRTHQKQ